MACPQCGTEIGPEAKACTACGWTKSRRTLWITLGCIFGGLFLICCGIGTVLVLRVKRIAEEGVPPMHVLLLRVQVVNYAKNHGGVLPDTLDKAAAEPLKDDSGGDVKFEIKGGRNNDVLTDMWDTVIRYTRNPDGSFEVRSAGKDKAFDNADDFFEKGRADEDLAALKKVFQTRAEEQVKKALGDFGVEVKVDDGSLEKKDEPAPPPPGGEAPGGGK